MLPTLMIGYGNVDRQDDGVAWHVLAALAQRLGRPHFPAPEEPVPESTGQPALVFRLQLTPELGELVAQYDRVCFIDAHTGEVQGEIHFDAVESEFQSSPFTHHMTPATCLALTETLYQKKPEAALLSVRGYEFGFARELSENCAKLVPRAVDVLYDWLQSGDRFRSSA